jgi:hypothetical protein
MQGGVKTTIGTLDEIVKYYKSDGTSDIYNTITGYFVGKRVGDKLMNGAKERILYAYKENNLEPIQLKSQTWAIYVAYPEVDVPKDFEIYVDE